MMIASGNASAQTWDIPFHELSVGNVNVRVVSLVQKDLNASILLPGTAQQKKAVADAYPDGAIHNVLNVLLLRAPGVAALVDTGFDWWTRASTGRTPRWTRRCAEPDLRERT